MPYLYKAVCSGSLVLAMILQLMIVQPVWAKGVQLLLLPTRVVLEGKERFTTMTVKNTGDATGKYRVQVVDTQMDEEGKIHLRDDGQRNAHSAADMLRVSPRVITLPPNEYQTVRILVKKRPDLEDGEYRSHLKVKITENNLEQKEAELSGAEPPQISLKPKLVMVIPALVRHGETGFAARIENVEILPPSQKAPKPHVKVTLTRTGNRSAMGDISIVHIAPGGGEEELRFFAGVAVYREIGRRSVQVPLDVDMARLNSGQLRVRYLTQKREGGEVLAEKTITLN